ncbi:MAG: pentapeptide repeat-containing protein [Nitrososphaera sp.]|nr:pentapeptide repeat-containing protein [Nitrososphaera sp.]
MIIKDWLLAIGGFTSGVLLGRWFARTQPPISPASIAGALPNPGYQPKLTREDVICLIEAYGGPEGLDLSSYDLSGVNLRNLDLHGVIFSTYSFDNRIYQSAKLAGANFTDVDLTRAYLTHTNLRNATFRQTRLYEATLARAHAEGAHFSEADLRCADLYGCQLEGASFWNVNLEGANLFLARLANAEMTEVYIGNALIQEREETYREHFDRWYVSNMPNYRSKRDLSERYGQAAEIYMNLKNAYLSSGRYREASWGYLKERRMRRATLAPWRAKSYYGDALVQRPGFLGWRRGWFYLKHTWLWFFDWLNDTTSGYGELPLRTLWLVLVIITLFPLFYRWSGQVVLQSGAALQWIDYFIFSLGAFTTMDFGRFTTTGSLAESIASIEALLGISILALLMFALGNRIRRP